MEESLNKLGIMDFFNVLFTGGIFAIGASWIFPWLWEQYININREYEYESYVGIIILFYTIGMILQEVGSFYDSNFEHIKDNVLQYFLQENKDLKVGLIEKIKDEIILGKERVKGKEIIGNEIKLKVYKEHGKEIIKQKENKIVSEFDKEQCKFIYAYCLYYIENQGKSAKYEKMRGLFDMARTMMSSSLLLFLGSSLSFLGNLIFIRGFNREFVNIIQMFLFALCVIIFHSRAKRLMNYKARMLMEVYDVCKDIKNDDKIKKENKDIYMGNMV